MDDPMPYFSGAYLAESRAARVTIAAWVTTAAAMLVVALKLVSTGLIKRAMGLDDIFICVSTLMSLMATISVQMAVRLGLGRHNAWVESQGLQQLADCLLWQTVGFPFNILAFSLPNISIAILIERLLQPNAVRKTCMYTMVVVQVVLAFIAAILYFAQCSPAQYLWDAARVQGICWDPSIFFDYYYFFSAYTALTDLILAVVPITAFWQLNMKQRTRLGLCVLMALTMLSAIVTVVKTYHIPLLAEHNDLLYMVVPLVEWGLIEQNVVIIAASLPTLRPLFAALGGWRHGDDDGDGSHGGASGATSGSGAASQGGKSGTPSKPEFHSSRPHDIERQDSTEEEMELNAVMIEGKDTGDAKQQRYDGDGSADNRQSTTSGSPGRTQSKPRSIVRTLQVNVDVSSDWRPEDGEKVKAHW